MSDNEFPVAVDWPLQEKAIPGELCQTCGLCCEMTISVGDSEAVRQIEFMKAVVEKHSAIKDLGDGVVSIRCSHLRETKSGWKRMECSIYDRRPQLCKDFNCVAWAKVSNNQELYHQVVAKAAELRSPSSEFSEEIKGPDT